MNASCLTSIDNEVITKTKFQSIKEELDRNYNDNDVYNNKLKALKGAIDELLTLLDKAVYIRGL